MIRYPCLHVTFPARGLRAALHMLGVALLAGAFSSTGSAQVFGLQEYGVHRAGRVPEDIAVADFDGDGRPDIAVANTNAAEPAGVADETVSIFLNLGGDFAHHVEYPVGDRPEGIVAEDFDGDGIVDLATADFQGSSVSVLRGNGAPWNPGSGDGSFTPWTRVAVTGAPRGLTPGDFDGDGIPDLATANYSGSSVSILLGDGAGGFSVAKTLAVGKGPEVVSAGDVDSDGLSDLVTANAVGDTISILRGTGSSTLFAAAQSLPVGDNPRHARLLDLDADGFDEIVVANHLSSTVTVLKTSDGAAFGVHATLSRPDLIGPIYTGVGDLDGDGFPDLVVTYAKSNRFAVYPGAAGATFGPPDQTPAGRNALGVAVTDFDGDGRQDIAVTNALDDNLYVYYKSASSPARIIDNGAAGTGLTGSWSTSGAPNPYGPSSLYAKATAGTTYAWTSSVADGSYAVLAWWTQLSTRNAAAPYAVVHAGGTTVVPVDQRTGGGRWQTLGTHHFQGSGRVQVSSTSSTESTCADAVCFLRLRTDSRPPVATIVSIEPNPGIAGSPVELSGRGEDLDGAVEAYEWTSSLDGAIGREASFRTSSLSPGTHAISLRVQDDRGFWSQTVSATLAIGAAPPPGGGLTAIMDDGDAGTSFTGTWSVSGALDPYGTRSLYAKNGPAYRYAFSLTTTGTYDVYAWWTQYPSRSLEVPYEIAHAGGTTAVKVDQRTNGGRWNHLGTFSFGTTAVVTIRAVGSASTCADAVALDLVSDGGNQPPTARIDSISPSPADEGQTVSFVGVGEDPDGAVVAHEWTSSLDGLLSTQASFSTASLSVGTHTIGFRVKDDRDVWSDGAPQTLEIRSLSGLRALDNGDTGTSYTGTWSPSGGANPYGPNSLYAKSGPTYTYAFPLASPGRFEVFAWWTEYPSRPNAAPYDIVHAGGLTTVLVDQRTGGGKWRSLGTFDFSGEATVTIRALGTASTCADAVAIGPAPANPGNALPTATIGNISPSPSFVGQTVSFVGIGADPDGAVTAHEWTSSLDGVLSTAASFSTASLSLGTHTVGFRVKDDRDAWSARATALLEVRSSAELIMDNGAPGTSSVGGWSVSGATNFYGANSIYAKNSGHYRYTFDALAPGTYRVSAWWTIWSSRSTAVPITVAHAGGESTVSVNQQKDGGRWNVLGEFSFEDRAVVTIAVVGPTSTCADAVKLEKVR